ncbi:MAG TPA: hypothetical protein VHT51_03970 [Micropepsaceae bacterium]|jgi:hypothetical protein|nr:hypothetical protein [Micropepsaceae bacterium]
MIDVVSAEEAKLASPPRSRVFVLAIIAGLGGFSANPAIAAGAAAGPDISGVWWATNYSPKIQLVGGGDLPYTPAGKMAYEKNIAALKSGEMTDVARRFCVPDGIPRVLATPYPLEIIQTPGQTTIVYELNHAIRIVAMDKPMPKDEELIPYPYYNGHSVGHWDGDTLVVETAGFNDKTFLDATGAPHSDAMKTVERIHKIGANQLEDVISVHDPDMFTRDWSARYVYNLRNDIRLQDYVCGEKHRDLSSVRGVAGH